MKKVCVLGLFVSTLALADTTSVDWTNLTLKATVSLRTTTASDRPDVGEKFLTLLKATYFDANQNVGDVLRFDFQKEAQLIPNLQDYRRVDERYLTDGTQEVDYEITLPDRLLRLIQPKPEPIKLVVPMCCPTCGQVWPQNKRVPENTSLVGKEENVPSNYTSIVIDGRGTGLHPALFPRVKNDRGEEVYSKDFAQPEYVAENGLVLYLNDIQDIYTNPRIGYNPMRISAIGVSGRNKVDPVISQFDAAKIHGSKNMLDLLTKCRVIFVVGR